MTPWEILKKAEQGSVNFGNVFKTQKADRKKNITLAQSLVKDGLLEPIGNSNVYHLTGRGLLAVQYDSLDDYYKAEKSDPNLKVISDAVDTVKDIYSGNKKTQKIVLIVSVVTGIAIVSQAFIAYKSHQLSIEEPKSKDLLPIDSTLQNQQLQLNQTKIILDSLKLEFNTLSMKKDSICVDSIKLNNK